jgi:hypothetical protein
MLANGSVARLNWPPATLESQAMAVLCAPPVTAGAAAGGGIRLARYEARPARRRVRAAEHGRVRPERLIQVAADDLPVALPPVVRAHHQIVRADPREDARVSAYPTTRFPSPFTAPSVFPEADTICTFTAPNRTVGLPPTPDETNVGASTAVLPAPHDGVAPVPPDTTA